MMMNPMSLIHRFDNDINTVAEDAASGAVTQVTASASDVMVQTTQ